MFFCSSFLLQINGIKSLLYPTSLMDTWFGSVQLSHNFFCCLSYKIHLLLFSFLMCFCAANALTSQ